jgi:site-specific DNA-methyltransferase (adenine-specific)
MDYTLHHGDCLEVMATMADNSVDAVVADPPYFKVKSEWWDRQWDKPAEFLAWLDQVAEQWQRILKPNGSLYCFASPKMAARVEVMLEGRFCVLNHVRWVKEAGWHQKASKEEARMFKTPWEGVIFCEHYGADNIAKGEAGYGAKCDELRGFVFEPLRAYLDGERQRAGCSTKSIMDWFAGNGFPRYVTARHSFTTSQWELPTPENYSRLRQCFQEIGRPGQYLRREYEDLRREYEDLRRPFSVSADVPYTDVWTFPTVQHYPGKHPCEKPAAMLEHIIAASTRPGAVVLDCFAGSGATLLAARNLGRLPIGIEIDDHWVQVAKARLEGNQPPQRPTRQPAPASPGQLALF